MEFIQKTSPFLRRPSAQVTRMMRDVVIALSPLIVFAVITHGMRAVWILLVAIVSMVVTEYLYYQYVDFRNKEKWAFKNKSFTLYNYTVIVSGLIYGLILPDQVPLFIVAIGGVIGVLFAKLFFGGMGQNIFNIAAFARVFVGLSFGAALVYTQLDDAHAGATVLQALGFENITDRFTLWQMFSGIGLPGSLGETSALLILVGGLYLALRKSFDIVVPLTYVGTVFLLSLAVMVKADLGFWYPMTHLLSGGLMFGAVFMATDPVTIPVSRPGRIYFAFGLGLFTFVIRVLGSAPEGVVFSILIMNMFVPAIDYAKWSKSRFTTKRLIIFVAIVILSVLAVYGGVSVVS